MYSNRRAYALISLIAAFVSCESATAPPATDVGAASFDRSASAPVHHVSGGGQLDVAALFPASDKESYGFSASVDGDGIASGQIQIDFGDSEPFHADVTCLAVNGNSAWIGAVVTQTHDEQAVPVGTQLWVRVQDNGEGGSGSPDRMSFVRLAPASFCALQRPAGMPFEWQHGNIRIR